MAMNSYTVAINYYAVVIFLEQPSRSEIQIYRHITWLALIRAASWLPSCILASLLMPAINLILQEFFFNMQPGAAIPIFLVSAALLGLHFWLQPLILNAMLLLCSQFIIGEFFGLLRDEVAVSRHAVVRRNARVLKGVFTVSWLGWYFYMVVAYYFEAKTLMVEALENRGWEVETG